MKKTFSYFASGGYLKPEYNSLPFDRVILIDKVGDGEKVNRRLDLSKKIINLKVECNHAIDWMIENNIKLDALMIKNEGLGEGGGDYPLFGRSFFSRVFPILKNKSILVTQMNYYGDLYQKLIDKLPIELKKIENTEYQSSFGKQIDVFEIKKKEVIHEVSKINNIQINSFINKSVWEDKDKLDAIFVNVNSSVQIEQITEVRKSHHFGIVTECNKKRSKYYEGVYFISSNDYQEMSTIINKLNYSKIGIMDCYEETDCFNTNTIKDNSGNLDMDKFINSIKDSNAEVLNIYKFDIED
jgi:hypothetical protein